MRKNLVVWLSGFRKKFLCHVSLRNNHCDAAVQEEGTDHSNSLVAFSYHIIIGTAQKWLKGKHTSSSLAPYATEPSASESEFEDSVRRPLSRSV